MNLLKIKEATLSVFRFCHITSFPIDCTAILKQYGYRVFTYRELQAKNKSLYEMCKSYSEDAFKWGQIVAYNDEKPFFRIAFTLAHEIGHHILGHQGESPQYEKEADTFASHLLAPRLLIHFSACKRPEDVSKTFGLSFAASEIAYRDYKQWYRLAYYKTSLLDRQFYHYFYQPAIKDVVWNQKFCQFCGITIYNSHLPLCSHCQKEESSASKPSSFLSDYQNFEKAEANWLYGDL